MDKKRVLLGVTGSIAVYKACDLVRRLQDAGCEVTVVMTACAEKFVSSMTFEALSRRPVYRDMFARDVDWDMAHISLAKWADVYVIAPVTANVIGKIAGGIADDLVTCTAVTTTAPVLLAPAMNVDMFTNTIVQENIEKLKRHGIQIIDPRQAKLACGDVGTGALAEVETIVESVLKILKK